MNPGLTRALRVAALAGALVAVGLAGALVGLRLAGPAEHQGELGRVSFTVSPALHGHVDAYVPLADWGMRVKPYSSPFKLHVEARSLDREAVLAAASGDRERLGRFQHDLQAGAQKSVLRALAYALAGAVLAALFAGVTALALRRRRRLVISYTVIPCVAWLLIAGAVLAQARLSFDSQALAHPTFYARGAELSQLLDASDRARKAGDSYTNKVEESFRGFAALLSGDRSQQALGHGRPAIVASDLHNNTPALDSLAKVADGQPVFMVGDFSQSGNAAEVELLAPRVAALGRVIAVSGNHDSLQMMRALAREGATVLTSEGVLRRDGTVNRADQDTVVDGLRVAGFSDPLESKLADPDDPERIYSYSERPEGSAEEKRAQQKLVRWFDRLRRRPDVVLVHQNGLAQHLGRVLGARQNNKPVTILTGHDHKQHVSRYGSVAVVDGGTLGAGGLYGVGKDPVGLARLHFDRRQPRLRAADLVRVEPVSGTAEAQRLVLNSPACPRSGRCRATLVEAEGRERSPARP